MEQYLTWIWAGLLVVFFIAEITTVQLVSVWFCVGALAALIVSCLTDSFAVQAIVFTAVSAAALVLSRKLFKDKLQPKPVPTNADMIIGRTAVVLQEVTPDFAGRVKVDSQTWAAKSSVPIPAGRTCKVTEINGVTLTVVPNDNKPEEETK